MSRGLNRRSAKEPATSRKRATQKDAWGWVKYGLAAEIILIGCWAMFVGRAYLNFDPRIVPTGNEFGSQVQTNHVWTQFQKCGWCAVWNGSEQGGLPAFVDVHGSLLHPLVIVTTLIWGVVNGVKVVILLALWLAGLAQWWIAKELKLGVVPRLWSAAIVVAGGHLASRMETGNYNFLLETAAASLLLAGVISVARRGGGTRRAVLLGVLLASVLLSGQGYLQIGLLTMLPACAAFMVGTSAKRHPILVTFLWALLVAVLLAAPLLVPFLHFLPNFTKDSDAGTFGAAQPLAYLPLNLVINDYAFFYSTQLEKLPYPQLYALYVGWIPVLLAILGLSRIRDEDRPTAWFMGIGAGLAFLVASGIVFRAAFKFWPALGFVRFPSVIAALAIPLILGFSAYGLDELIRWSGSWPKLSIGLASSRAAPKWQLPLQWLLILPLLWSLQTVNDFASRWYKVTNVPDQIYHVLAALRTESLQWVEPPFGALGFVDPAVAMGLKLSPGFIDVHWKGRELPKPVLFASFSGQPPGTTEKVSEVDGVEIYASQHNYASVTAGTDEQPCSASGAGGRISIACNVAQPGRLVVQENTWNGWYAWLDGKPVPLLGDKWLGVDAPAGNHLYEFRYLPWDVPLGLAIFVIGIGLCVWLWHHAHLVS